MAAVLPLLLASCQQEELSGMNGTSDLALLAVTITDGGYAPAASADGRQKAATRATENGYRTDFTAGDECGLYIVRDGKAVYENVKLTATAGSDGSLTWQPEKAIAGGMDGESYFLYYPYQADMTGKTDASVTDDADFFAPLISGWQPASDQSDYAASYTASDLMTATGTATTSADGMRQLSFSMTHRMALAVIVIPGEKVYKFTDSSIPDYTVKLSATDFSGEAKPCANGDNTYRYLVNPKASSAPTLTGIYACGKVGNEFAVTTGNMDAGFYKTYKVDGAAPIEINYNLQTGDYFCKNSSHTWYIIPGTETPGSECIGIVFHAGQHPDDQSDYSKSGIGQSVCHGYVVALTDVHNDYSDILRWEYKNTGAYDRRVGASTDENDWNGYANCQQIHKFVVDNSFDGWEMKYFPAALACETYGNRTTDQDGFDAGGKYDWQKPLAAPDNTSGWFLPSCGQLLHLYNNRSFLSVRMTEVKDSTPADCDYKDKIKWFGASCYWSSTEHSSERFYAWRVYFYYGNAEDYDAKYYPYDVRAVLAF